MAPNIMMFVPSFMKIDQVRAQTHEHDPIRLWNRKFGPTLIH